MTPFNNIRCHLPRLRLQPVHTLALVLALLAPLSATAAKPHGSGQHNGQGLSNCVQGNCGAYFGVYVNTVEGYQSGYSWYSAIWPLRHDTPAPGFQIGLGSTWIIPDPQQIRGPARAAWHDLCGRFIERDKPAPPFQSIEGGFGYWRDTRFASAMPKWRTHSNSNCYHSMEGLTGWPTQHNLKDSPLDIGMIQLSNRLLMPADGETFPLDTVGQLLGVAWMHLPLPPLPAGQNGQHPLASVLFVQAANFKGPLAYWPAGYFSGGTSAYPALQGHTLDVQSLFMHSMASEFGSVPLTRQRDRNGVLYTQIPELHFPVDQDNRTVFARDLTGYSDAALATRFAAWLQGKPGVDGRFDMSAAHSMPLRPKPRTPDYFQDGKRISGLAEQMEVAIFDQNRAWGLQWHGDRFTGTLPAYFRDEANQRTAVARANLPTDVHFAADNFTATRHDNVVWRIAYPDAGTIARTSKPGGHATLTDGSTVTYVWFRFVDQPALIHWHLGEAQRNELQALVERLHRSWSNNVDYWAPPSSGSLVSFDPALLVQAPAGLEAGYVPVIIEQRGPQAGPPLP